MQSIRARRCKKPQDAKNLAELQRLQWVEDQLSNPAFVEKKNNMECRVEMEFPPGSIRLPNNMYCISIFQGAINLQLRKRGIIVNNVAEACQAIRILCANEPCFFSDVKLQALSSGRLHLSLYWRSQFWWNTKF